MSQIAIPATLFLAALAISNTTSDETVSADYSEMAQKPSQKTNSSMKTSTHQTPSWAVGARLNDANLGVQAKKNLVGKTLVNKVDKVGHYNFFEDRDLERYSYAEVHTGKGIPGSEVLPSVVEPLTLGSGPQGSTIYTRQRIPLNDPRVMQNKAMNKLLDEVPYEALPPPLPVYGQHQPTHVGGGVTRGTLQLQPATHYPFKRPNSKNFFSDDVARPAVQKPKAPPKQEQKKGFFASLFG
tara:strand:- start:714 stop:1433 length:720 start_codon:yes stop_codon:yes gene_type:complete